MPHRFETLALHTGLTPDGTGSRQLPIHQTTSYVFESTEQAAKLFALQDVGYIYSRLTNPTVAALQERVTALEGGIGTACTASGHAAQLTALFNLMQSGDHIVVSKRLYGGSINQFSNSFPQFGWSASFVDINDEDALSAAIQDNTKAVFAESLANPDGNITDMEQAARVAHKHGIPLLIDNTMATAYLCKPIEYGADIVLNSTTKFLSGNGTAVGGSITDSGKFDWSQNDKFPLMTREDPSYHGLKFHDTFGEMAFTFRSIALGLRDLGASQSPMNAYLTMLGIETLPLRMERHCQNALEVARYLQGHDKVKWVSYAGLPDSPYNALASTYLKNGHGAVFTFGLEGGDDAGRALVESCKLFSHLANIGDSRSLIIHPASTTHSQLPDEQKSAAGAGPEVVRVSIGLENVQDIIADLDQALEQV